MPADFCAEHECGIKSLMHSLGVRNDESVHGIERYRIPVPAEGTPLFFTSWQRPRAKHVKAFAAFLIGSPWHRERAQEHSAKLEFSRYELSHAEWDEGGMYAYFTNDDAAKLAQIHQAILAGEGCIMMGGGSTNPFDRGGLVLGIIPNIPDAVKASLRESHENTAALNASLNASLEATGIVARLKVAGRGYYALKPEWASHFKTVIHPVTRESRPLATAYPVVVFLNPYDQHQYNSGWFTVEELTEWARGGGIVVRSSAPQQA